ncbi:ferrochelatase-2, chloroplastic-like isoform X1 [Gossypium arboreum]|uniref:ferrochelatase-2, chloroplastic-like isoform X1 n=1 Tax=Gossypium arboreum TaxID=29729 RepID=UPI0022F19B10|nr:ferrochelatase-2, chloroplastic-like isoform X1 [Gossypium arboreum]
MQHTVIPSWYQREGYIKSMANLIEKALKKFDRPEKVVIFFTAHGVPLAYVEEAGDPYKAEMEECVDLIIEELEKRKITNAYTLAYQVLLVGILLLTHVFHFLIFKLWVFDMCEVRILELCGWVVKSQCKNAYRDSNFLFRRCLCCWDNAVAKCNFHLLQYYLL